VAGEGDRRTVRRQAWADGAMGMAGELLNIAALRIAQVDLATAAAIADEGDAAGRQARLASGGEDEVVGKLAQVLLQSGGGVAAFKDRLVLRVDQARGDAAAHRVTADAEERGFVADMHFRHGAEFLDQAQAGTAAGAAR